MELESIIKEFRESTLMRKDFYVIVNIEGREAKAFDVTAYKVSEMIRLDIKEHKE